MWIKKRRWPVVLWILSFLLLAAATGTVIFTYHSFFLLSFMPAFLSDAVLYLTANVFWLWGVDAAFLLALFAVLITAPGRRERARRKELLERYERFGSKFDEEEADITY